METISAIVTAYNYATYLVEALDCLLGQTFPLHEIIVVDDASTDNTQEVAEGMFDAAAQGDPTKRLTPLPEMKYILHAENQGLPVARNTGITESTGDCILILDADDRLALEFAAKCMDFLHSNPNLSGVYTWQKWFGTPEFSLGQVYKNPPWDFQSLLYGNMMNDCSLYRREVWEDCQRSNGHGYNPKMWGWCGYEFYIHAGKLGHKFGLLEEPLYFYRRGHETLGGRAWGHREELTARIRQLHPELYP